MPHLVTAHKGEDHVESYNSRHYNAGLVGNDSYAFKGRGNFACSMVNTNTLRIMSGDAQCCGAHWAIDSEYEEYTIENGNVGYKRIDLVVAHLETAPEETIDIRVLKGTETTGEPVTPTYIEGDLNAGDTVVETPICRVPLDGINVGSPEMLLKFLTPYSEAWDSISHMRFVNHNVTLTNLKNGLNNQAFDPPKLAGYSPVAIVQHINYHENNLDYRNVVIGPTGKINVTVILSSTGAWPTEALPIVIMYQLD